MAVVCVAVGLCARVSATPIVIDYEAIDPLTSEDFEAYPTGNYSGPFDGFSILFGVGSTGSRPGIANDGTYCITNCLVDRNRVTGKRRLFDFAAGTTAVGFLLDTSYDNAFDPPQGVPSLLRISVIGNSGELAYGIRPTEPLWLGFYDPTGLESITVANWGATDPENPQHRTFWQYVFDDVITGRAAPGMCRG
jgi:hypothetical protein